MNPDQLPSVSTFRVEKPGKSKFAPSIGGRKAAPTSSQDTATTKDTLANINEASSLLANERDSNETPDDLVVDLSDSPLPSTVGKKIESIQSRRMAERTTPAPVSNVKEDQMEKTTVKMPSGPKDAASIATASTSSGVAEKRTMAYYLKDSGEGREMPSSQSQANSSTSDPTLSPSKTRRIVNLRNIKAPPRSAATSTALAPQVRVVDGAIVYDEKFSAALTIPSTTANIEQELEYVDEDDENGKHLTSATYSTRAKGSNRWNPAETDLFYDALSMCGTDFSMVQTLFPHRTRPQIKGKYKLEERANASRINAALRNKKTFDPNFKDRVREFMESNKK